VAVALLVAIAGVSPAILIAIIAAASLLIGLTRKPAPEKNSDANIP